MANARVWRGAVGPIAARISAHAPSGERQQGLEEVMDPGRQGQQRQHAAHRRQQQPRGCTAGRSRQHKGGDSPLTEDGRIEAAATTVVNLRAGWRFDSHLELAVDVFNLFDVGHPDISDYFASCIPGDPASACDAALPARDGVEDIHLHPVEPRSLRASLRYRF